MDDYSFQFVDYKLISLSFGVTNQVEKGVPVEINPTLKIKSEPSRDMINVTLEVSLENGDLPFSFDISIGGQFKFTKEISQINNIEKIVNVNCAAILFPFLRETVADVTRRSGYAPLILPPVNFCLLHEEMVKAKGLGKKDA